MSRSLPQLSGLLELNVSIPALANAKNQEFWHGLTQKVESVFSRTGKGRGGDIFLARQKELRVAVQRGENILTTLRHVGYIRPLVNLWNVDSEFLKEAPPDAEILAHLASLTMRTIKKRIGFLILLELRELFFRKYDNLENALPVLCVFFQAQLSLFSDLELIRDLSRLKANRAALIAPEGHIYLAEMAAQSGRPLLDVAQDYSVLTERARFYEASQIYTTSRN